MLPRNPWTLAFRIPKQITTGNKVLETDEEKHEKLRKRYRRAYLSEIQICGLSSGSIVKSVLQLLRARNRNGVSQKHTN